MKALVLKDCYVLWRQLRLFVVLMLVIEVFNGDFGSIFIVIWATMLPYTAMAYDEQCKWDQLAAMMPYSVRDIVLSKYVLGWLCTGAAGIFTLLAQTAVRALHLPLEAGTAAGVFPSICLSLCILSVNLPLMFRFGVEKGRLGMFLMVFLVCGTAAGLASLMNDSGVALPRLPAAAVLLLPAAAAAFTAASLPLSIRLYRRAHREAGQ